AEINNKEFIEYIVSVQDSILQEKIQKVLEMTELSRELQRQKWMLEALKLEFSGLEDQNSELQDNIGELQDSNSLLSSEIGELRDNNSLLNSEISELQDNNSALSSEIGELQDSNSLLSSEIGELQDEKSQRTILLVFGVVIAFFVGFVLSRWRRG
ncbi:unnamed protein product, partial [marine sediment metagenome]